MPLVIQFQPKPESKCRKLKGGGERPEGAGRQPVQIEVLDLETGISKFYLSIRDVSRYIGVHAGTISNYLSPLMESIPQVNLESHIKVGLYLKRIKNIYAFLLWLLETLGSAKIEYINFIKQCNSKDFMKKIQKYKIQSKHRCETVSAYSNVKIYFMF